MPDEGIKLDKYEINARKELETFFKNEANKEKVFYSRQVEILFEDKYFHWITNRAIRELIETGKLKKEEVKLKNGSNVHVIWHPTFRYYKRSMKQLVNIMEDYSDPNLSVAIGLNGEALILEGFAVNEFICKGREANEFNGKKWNESNHDLDFIFSRDGLYYGIEVKNMLGYMDHDELKIKLKLCKYLGLRPIIVARMLPKNWIDEINRNDGYAMILKYQLYPISFKELAKKVHNELGLPTDAPRRLNEGTMVRLLKWHEKNVKLK